ncbi:uncharacterized protein EV420DRAFT_1711792 [Desarmillaria tabescens]|uniref:F-box domain-containing protein n=1 Tax=Armillaria tabescens TaxID=1929756 RepID=A0AA39JVZ2_ARMTA|nr:uncharacterized protein EV420DRAFT_1711792 [Desarmillaria tabescens]KAK0448464.1 hypothetical protein EV420DRAFT_1711792 [Desarmillaria tabescens]
MSSNTNADIDISSGSLQPKSQNVVPINQLPLELLQSIFELASLSPVDPATPWRLLLVCKFWRVIVTSFPLLWTNIAIGNGSPNPDGFVDMGARSIFPVLMSYLRFSSLLPVNISVSIRGMPRHHSPLTRAHAGVLSHILRRLSHRIRTMTFTFDSWEFYGLLTEGLTHVQMPVLIQWTAEYVNGPLVIFNEGFCAKNLDCRFESTVLTAGTGRPHELVSRGIALYPNLWYLHLTSTPMSWDMFCPPNLIELHIHDLPPRYRPDAIQLAQILELSRDTLQILELSGSIFQDSALENVHTLKLGFSLAEELGGLFPELKVPALRSLEVNNLDRKSTWFDLAVTPAFQALAMFLPLHQLKHLRLDCITFHLPSNHLPNPGSGQDPVSLAFFKQLTSLTSLSLYSPDVVTFGCMNYSPDILPALQTLKISTPGVNYYEYILSFWQERARMPAFRMLEHLELTLPMCAEGRAEEFVLRKEVFAKRVVLDYQPDMHRSAWMLQDAEMGGDDVDEMDNAEIDESEDGSGEMDED